MAIQFKCRKRYKVLGGIGIMAIVLAALLAFRGGSAKDVAAVKAVTQAFLEASKNNDLKAGRPLLTEKARKNFPPLVLNFEENVPESSEIGDVTIKWNTAEVSIITQVDEGEDWQRFLKLRRESGEWRVYAYGGPLFPGGRTVLLDFENLQAIQEEMAQVLMEALKEAFSPPQSASPNMTTSINAKPRTSSSTSGTGRNLHTDAAGRKWIGEIPYDVFFDNPLEIANDDRPVGIPVRGSDTNQQNNSPFTGGDTTLGTGTDWKSVVSMETLEAEVKRIRNSMTGSLRGMGQYNAGYKDLQIDGGTLAAIAGIIIEHPDPISWKEDAKYIRDLGTRIEESSQKLGKKSFDATVISYEQFSSLLNRSKPADLSEADEKIPFADRADRSTLMRRIDKAFQQMKSNVTTMSALEEQKEVVLHESAILAALTKVIMTESYDLFDDEEYRNLAETMYQASKAIEVAVGEKDFSAFDKSLSGLNNACTQCHTSFRD